MSFWETRSSACRRSTFDTTIPPEPTEANPAGHWLAVCTVAALLVLACGAPIERDSPPIECGPYQAALVDEDGPWVDGLVQDWLDGQPKPPMLDPYYFQQVRFLQAANLDGDDHPEWLLFVVVRRGTNSLPELWIVGLDGALYVQSLQVYEPSNLHVTVDRDITGDDLPDVIWTEHLSGAHTGSLLVGVLTYHPNRLVDPFSPVPRDDWRGSSLARFSPYWPWVNTWPGDAEGPGSHPAVTVAQRLGSFELVDSTLGVPMLVLHGGLFNSSGAGMDLQRPYTQTWAWDGCHIAERELEHDPSDRRLHWLFDGDVRLANGDYEAALARYEAVAHDDTLADIPALLGTPTGDTARQLGAVRLVLTYLLLDDPEAAEGELVWLQANYADDEPLVRVAARMLELADDGLSPHAICEEARTFGNDLMGDAVLPPLGYANPRPTTLDVCPDRS